MCARTLDESKTIIAIAPYAPRNHHKSPLFCFTLIFELDFSFQQQQHNTKKQQQSQQPFSRRCLMDWTTIVCVRWLNCINRTVYFVYFHFSNHDSYALSSLNVVHWIYRFSYSILLLFTELVWISSLLLYSNYMNYMNYMYSI